MGMKSDATSSRDLSPGGLFRLPGGLIRPRFAFYELSTPVITFREMWRRVLIPE
jgi:hypothetical protein